ncbi:MAG: metallophosphoesterase family protein [Planctomycetota bacterium]|nr:metallophosphoesterase family protein [Planctomycetota bacterium]
MKILVLSDFHLGIPASRSGAMLDDIRRLTRDYDRVILNGDTLDRFEALGCQPHVSAQLKDIRDACSGCSGPPELIMGNHDPAISTVEWIYLEESATLVFHGDCVADCTHPTRADEKILAARLRAHWAAIGGRPTTFLERSAEFRRVQARHAQEYPFAREPRTALAYLASVLYPPQKPVHILQYWWRAPRLAARLAATFPKPVSNVAVAHTHRSGCWQLNGMTVFNTGSFMPLSVPCGLSIDGANVSLRPLAALLRATRSVAVPLSSAAPTTTADEVKA